MSYPEFDKLTEMMQSHLENGISCNLAEEIEESKRHRDDARLRYLETAHLYAEVRELCEEHALNPEESAKEKETLSKLLYAQHASQYVQPDGSLLGVVESDLMSGSDNIALHAMQRSGIPLLETRLRQKADKITEFAGCETFEKLLVEVTEAKLEKAKLEIDRKKEDTVFEQLLKTQELLLVEISQGIEDLKCGRYIQSMAALCEGLCVQAEAMESKMKLLEQKFLKDTYTKESMAALKKIDMELEKAAKSEMEKKKNLEMRKIQFDEAGEEEMEKIAKDYAQVLKSIQDVQWAMKNLKTK